MKLLLTVWFWEEIRIITLVIVRWWRVTRFVDYGRRRLYSVILDSSFVWWVREQLPACAAAADRFLSFQLPVALASCCRLSNFSNCQHLSWSILLLFRFLPAHSLTSSFFRYQQQHWGYMRCTRSPACNSGTYSCLSLGSPTFFRAFSGRYKSVSSCALPVTSSVLRLCSVLSPVPLVLFRRHSRFAEILWADWLPVDVKNHLQVRFLQLENLSLSVKILTAFELPVALRSM